MAETVTRGPVTARISADRAALPVAAPLALRLEVTAPDGVNVKLPDVGKELGPFHLRDAKAIPDVPVDGGRKWVQELRLVTYEAGELEIPALTVSFTDSRDSKKPVEGELETPALKIKVASALEGEFDPNQFADIKGAVALPEPWWNTMRDAAIVGAIAGGIAGVVAGILVWRRRGRRAKPVPEIPPHEWALAELRRLAAEDLVARGQVHTLYFRLTSIIRQYIERRFRIMAAEQTTREFLEAAKDHPALGGAHRPLLTQFLIAGDLVKFALHEPAEEEVRDALASARSFVEHTAPRIGAAAAAPQAEPTEGAAA